MGKPLMIAKEIERLQQNHETVTNHLAHAAFENKAHISLGDAQLLAETVRELLGYVKQLAERVEFEFDGRRPKL